MGTTVPPTTPTGTPVPPVTPDGATLFPLFPHSKKVVALRAAGILFTVILLVAGAGGLIAVFFQERTTQSSTIAMPVTRLVANTRAGDIRVLPGRAGAPAQVTSRLSWSFHKPTVEVTTVGGVLTITESCSQGFSPGQWCSTDLEVTLSPGTALDLRTGVGDVRVTGIVGDVIAKSDLGDIALDVPGSSSAKANTGIGDITVSGGSADARIQADANAGDVRLALASAPAEARVETGTGDVTIGVPAGAAYHVEAKAGVGEVTVHVPRDDTAPRQLFAHSDTGDVTIQTG